MFRRQLWSCKKNKFRETFNSQARNNISMLSVIDFQSVVVKIKCRDRKNNKSVEISNSDF